MYYIFCRLIQYEKNKNFGYEPMVKDQKIETPEIKHYKDINATSCLPEFTKYHLEVFLGDYNIPITKANNMYENGFLQYIRYCQIGKT